MPTCLALDQTGRAVAVPLRLAGGAEAVVTMIRLALDSIRGDWRADRDKGLPWVLWWQSPGLPRVLIEGEVRRQILVIEDVIEVREVIATRTNGHLGIIIDVAIREDESITLARVMAGTVDIVPGAWYSLVDQYTGPYVPG